MGCGIWSNEDGHCKRKWENRQKKNENKIVFVLLVSQVEMLFRISASSLNAALQKLCVLGLEGRVSIWSHLYMGYIRVEWDTTSESSGRSTVQVFSLRCCEAEPEQNWIRRSTVRHRSSSSSSGAARSGSLRPGPTNWLRCPGTSTPDTG